MSQIIPKEATKWGQLLALAGGCQAGWLPDELAEIWRHQLDAPLEVELAEAFPGWSPGGLESAMPRTFEELLNHPSPPMEVLILVKNMSKMRRSQSGFPPEIATAHYHAAIAIALARHGQRMTELDDVALRRGLQWTMDQSWLDRSTRAMLEIAMKNLLAA